MEYSKIDKQGRVVIPSNIRKALGIVGETDVIISIDGRRIIVEPVPRDLEKIVDEWIKMVLSSKLEIFSEKTEEEWKWLDDEYARKKLGLLPRRSS
ncbi:MAG: AbrB/MazE/SpoVT family DNA-binding domain-containing protein [Sulfolobales archaeon]